MGKFEGCLLASDIDGTLLENGYINPRNIEKIKYFINEGGKFCLCTGRSIGAITGVLEAVGVTTYSVVANGCMIYDHQDCKVVYEAFLPDEDRDIPQKIYSCIPSIGIEIHSGGNVFTIRQTYETDCHQKYEGLPTNCLDFTQALRYNWNKVLFALESETQYADIKDLTNIKTEGSDFIGTTATIDKVRRNYFEQIPKGVTKFATLTKLCEIADIKKGRLFAIGDYYNDLEMIKNADISAATADTPDDIKQYARFIAGKCDDGAVADFIDYLNENI